MKDLFRTPFIILFLVFGIFFCLLLLLIPKGVMELSVNHHHTPGLDVFCTYITNLGDGALLALLLVGLLFYNYYFSIITAISILLQSIIVSVFKRWLYSGAPRPLAFFPEGTPLNFVDGVEVHKFNSFPSGHTATAFAIFMILVLVAGKGRQWTSYLFFVMALSVGFSRVYLLQHFVVDVWFGALFGILSVIMGMLMVNWFFPQPKILWLTNHSLRNQRFRKAKDGRS